MSFVAANFVKHIAPSTRPTSPLVSLQSCSKLWQSTVSFDSDNDDKKSNGAEDSQDDFIPGKPEAVPQSVDPRRGWNFRGVHKAIICGKVGQTPVQKLLRNGKTLTIFNVGTGGMSDQRIIVEKDMAKPPQWHRIVVHNEPLGAYAVQQLVKNSPVYVEGDIEVRVYNKSITGEIVKLPEICVRNDGKIRLIKTGESISNISFEELKEGLL
ncbi:hypothetical protein Nepgr_012277 [Nepenthes gracilis]|uniref:Single-stranded DNA-binding protein, mitochondrial n=1 Tax=Nepenthes gracilis TaxID=150966 RepID=A0AAD3SH94_NEPGR|nr:hypothetical protein Nepgr_012277 [Nepenthes gracilis]